MEGENTRLDDFSDGFGQKWHGRWNLSYHVLSVMREVTMIRSLQPDELSSALSLRRQGCPAFP